MKLMLFLSIFGALQMASASKLEPIASWSIISSDQQTFQLREEKLDGKIVHSVSFLRGQRELQSFPISEPTWTKWRNQMTEMMTSFPQSKGCAHSHRFEIDKAHEGLKSKTYCLGEIMQSERKKIQKLVTDMKVHLYGP